MGRLLFLFTVMALAVPARAAETTEDPYAPIRRIVEPNGLEVYLAPQASAKTFRIKIRVKAGFAAESDAQAGVSHLLEHYLFTDANLEKNMTYLEVIKEKGGDGNATTGKMATNYFATVPTKHAKWLVDVFAKMIFRNDFEQARIERVRKPVMLEIGQPGILSQLWRFGILQIVEPEFLRTPDFWESEYGVYRRVPTHSATQWNTLFLTADDLRSYYEKYYHPANITAYFSGNFDPKVLMPLIEKLYGTHSAPKGETLDDTAKEIRAKPYLRDQTTSGTPRIGLGIKAWDLTLKEEITLRVYLEYLTHRIMKEIRNKSGDTYTSHPNIGMVKNFGFFGMNMEAPPAKYRAIRDYVKQMMDSEARDGKLTEKQFAEAVELYSRHFILKDRDSGTMMSLADESSRVREAYGSDETIYAAFRSIKYADFVSILKKRFTSDRLYSSLIEPPFVFRYEFVILVLISLMVVFFNAERILSGTFEHAKIRLVRKFAYPPLYFAEVFALALGMVLSKYLVFLLTRLSLESVAWQSTYFLSEYAVTLFDLVLASACCVFVFSRFKKKIIVCGDQLYLKSITYQSTKIALSEVDSLEALRPFSVLVSPSKMKSVLWRFFYYDPLFWRQGLYLKMRSGKGYYLGVKEAGAVRDELKKLIADSGSSIQAA